MKIRKNLRYFTPFEYLLWLGSMAVITASFFIFGGDGYLTLAASLVGVTSLIFCAKGNPVGQVLMIIFSVLYGVISFSFSYYGEMITYLGMTLPMAVFALISWLRNPYGGSHAEVKVNSISRRELALTFLATAAVTAIFYFILAHLGTANLLPSTLSVSTSFLGAYLTFRRSPYFALGYACNDVVLVVLWVLASFSEPRYISVAVCFAAFLANDLYGFASWQKMKKRQGAN